MNNDSKSSQDPKQPFHDPNKRDPLSPNQPAQPINPIEPSYSSTEHTRTYANDPSQYASKSASAEPSKLNPSNSTADKGSAYTNPTGASRQTNDYTQKDKEHYQKESMEDKVRDTFRNIRDSKPVDEMYNYARNNKEHTITYILLAIGLLLLIFLYESIVGELIIGAVAGYHFASQITHYLRNIGQVFAGQDQLRYVVLTGLILGLFIEAPGIFIGALIVAAFKQVFLSKEGQDNNIRSDKSNNGNGGINRPKDRY